MTLLCKLLGHKWGYNRAIYGPTTYEGRAIPRGRVHHYRVVVPYCQRCGAANPAFPELAA